MSQAWTLIEKDKRVAELVFDLPNEKVNKFTPEVMQELEDHLDALRSKDLSCLLFRSKKEGIFIAGADIQDIQGIKDEVTAQQKLKKGQDVFNKIENLPFPTIAVIEGACLGGGMELALACKERWVSDHPKTSCGLPEVKLGILPGWGGTQRLPKLIGLQKALDMILTGKNIPALKAYKMGLANLIFSSSFAEERIKEEVDRLVKGRPIGKAKAKSLKDQALENNPVGRALVFHLTQKQLDKKGAQHYPALGTILNLIRDSQGDELIEGLKKEREYFSKLIVGEVSPNLIQVFFNNESIKKSPTSASAIDLKGAKVGVIGAGVMGGGIAWLFASKQHDVRMKDLQPDAIAKGLQAAHDVFKGLKKRRRVKDHDISNGMMRISGTLDNRGLNNCALVVEAVVENMEIKKKVLQELDSILPKETIICTNTSALSITEMADGLQHPERVVGMHFFNPVHRMPLVEIIPGEKTSEQTIATIFKCSQQLGKTPIVVQNCAGFLVNRILLAYMNEAARCLEDGANIEQVDRIMTDYGMPMGPFHLTDEVGIDVGYHVAKTLESAYGERMNVSAVLETVYKEKLLGKKGGIGFYTWNGKNKQLNESLQDRLKTRAKATSLDDHSVLKRCSLTMIREAILCLEESVVDGPAALDMGMLMGTGFPPFRGGPILSADRMGLEFLYKQLEQLQSQVGERFAPPSYLKTVMESHTGFYEHAASHDSKASPTPTSTTVESEPPASTTAETSSQTDPPPVDSTNSSKPTDPSSPSSTPSVKETP